jgi:putative peptidoglycan lipid II flippase
MLEHGHFDRISTIGTATAVLYYSLGLWAFAGVRIVSQAFYSLQDTKTPVKIAMLALGANISLSVILMTPLEHGGLALAASLAAMLNLGLLTVRLRKKIGRMDGRRILQSLLKIVPAAGAMGVIGWWVALQPVWELGDATGRKLALLSAGIGGSVAFYLVVMLFLRSEELAFIWSVIRRKGSQRPGPGAPPSGTHGQ